MYLRVGLKKVTRRLVHLPGKDFYLFYRYLHSHPPTHLCKWISIKRDVQQWLTCKWNTTTPDSFTRPFNPIYLNHQHECAIVFRHKFTFRQKYITIFTDVGRIHADNNIYPGPLSTKRADVLPQDLVKSRSLGIRVQIFQSLREIWQVPRQQRCRDVCQISERYDHHSTQSE